MACIYTINGKSYTDEDFDIELSKRLSDSRDIIDKLPKEKLFSLSQYDNSVTKADNIRDLFRSSGRTKSIISGEDLDPIKIHDIPGNIGVTAFIEQYGNPKRGIDQPILNPFDENSWETNQRNKLSSSGLSTTDIDRIVSDTKGSWDDLREFGDDIHAIYEDVFNDDTVRTPKKLPKELMDSVIEQAKAFKSELIDKYGGSERKVKFYPELTIASKELDPDLKTLLGEKGITNICGIIDLLVIDAQGNPHIFDYKTSRKEFLPNSWDVVTTTEGYWRKDKKDHVKNQLAAYNAMLQQYGFGPATCEVVPIHLNVEYSDSTNSKIINVLEVTQQGHHSVPETSNGLIYGNWKNLIPLKVSVDSEELTSLFNKHQTLIPTEHVRSLVVKQFEASVEYYRNKHVKEVTSSDKHFGEYKYYFVKYQTDGRREYAKDETDLNEKLSRYVQKVKEKKDSELHSLASTLRMSLAGEISLEDFINDYNIRNREFLGTQMGRYINEGWTIISDENMIGYGLFIFKLGNRSEIVVMSDTPLHDVIDLGKGKSILGRTIEDEFIDSKEILPASHGNIEAMKALLYVSEHPELFTDARISQIVTMNPWEGQKTAVLNSQWITNYNRLVDTVNKDSNIKKVDSSLFWDDIPSMLSIADSYLRTAETPFELPGFSENGILLDPDAVKYTEDYIMDAIKQMQSKYTFLKNGENQMRGNQNIWLAYNYLYQSLLALRGLKVYSELEPGGWLSSGLKMGLYINSSGYSPSTNFRVFDDVMQQFALEVRLAVEKQGRPLIPALNKFYEQMGRMKVVGGEADYFKRWFRKDSEGKIDKSFMLQDPDNGNFTGAEQEALRTWLEVMASLRWPKKEGITDEQYAAEIQRKKDSGEYYEVPLTEAALSRQVKGLGFKQAVKNKWQELRELNADVFAGKTEERNRHYEKTPYQLFNKLDRDQASRVALIEENGVGFFETNLEDVIYQALVSYNKSRLSRKYIPIIDGMRIALRANQSYGGAKMEETITAFDKLVKSKFYGESIVDEPLQPYMKWIQAVKSGFSMLQLGFNFRSFFRELFQGTWMGLSRSGVELLPGITLKTYTEGALHVVTNAHKNFSNVSLLQQLNSQYGMANYSMGNIARQRRMNWWGIKNFRTDTMFMTSSAPDFQHRMAILVAKMMGDGCWEAHSLDENGFITYDFTKDSRFTVYLSGDKSTEEYYIQRANYLNRIAELNRVGIAKEDGSTFKEGDALPIAYLPREIQSIKNFADLLYGHYDDESKSLVNDMLLGSAFLQYKTYVTSRAEQWAMNPGVYNTTLFELEKDEITGEQLYKVHNDLDENGMPNIEVLTKKQIEQKYGDFNSLMEEPGRIEVAMRWKGLPMEGMGRSFVNFGKDMMSWNWADFKERWNNPTERDNILLGLHDCLFMSLMLMLMTALFGLVFEGEWTTDNEKIARAMRKNGWGESFMYNVAYGSFQDFPFWQVVGSMFNDLNPSVLTSSKKIVSTTGNVIMGKKSIWQATTNTIGALGDLKGWADRLAEAAE